LLVALKPRGEIAGRRRMMMNVDTVQLCHRLSPVT
jgi:hypothetical protein